jgi:hypothetical protein
MNRFLHHLVERAQGVGERLERRRPALFESRRAPPRGMDDLATHAPAWESPAAAETRIVQRTEFVPPVQATPSTPATLAPPSTQALAMPAPLRSPELTQLGTPQSHARPDDIEPRPLRESLQRVPSLQTPHSSLAAQPSSAHSSASDLHAKLTPPTDHIRSDRVSELTGKAHSESATVLPPPPRLPVSTASTTAVAHPARRAHGSHAPAPTLASPPPVQVSIGRIEIRAAAAPAPARPAAASQSPALTLDDYLRRRHGDRQ